jgi:hypothetical protein
MIVLGVVTVYKIFSSIIYLLSYLKLKP